MQLTTLITLFATAIAVSATPVELEEKRQLEGAPRVYARFFRDNGCGPTPWAEDTVFLQSETVGLAGCQDLTVGPFASTSFDINNFSRTVRFFNLPCSQLTSTTSGNFVDIAPGQAPSCKNLAIRSWVTI
ncbi:uncharacterized protein J4E87_000167 [Alternaria ethzedia]|uniref:uncharacterized protein n=1 Tax=Alternaria viburni TaxID=566460 RepID=UPI0020C2B741|nr:uncharacterized protein J4E79_000985 [Alternaria viburni]XP_049226651.1 uncharacterized protein J4E78_000706 [Alternaria triticimaculans]XP_049237960.1 uncharacterized protein J4E87_000167 [Alternaria ethzedia]XP_051330830.1 uncharacterized protein J4E85_000015 [Alternaria conjuncta]XP_051357644.1 uncharacterized protein J4E92_000717 [Alternaria infectoria]KAI4713634.1 hypothetical protein J4E89_001081 [Alternaria sp. Ai002NY15]KAI4635217.1 hypothetical protein J4E87_000167 [Alternaria eth